MSDYIRKANLTKDEFESLLCKLDIPVYIKNIHTFYSLNGRIPCNQVMTGLLI